MQVPLVKVADDDAFVFADLMSTTLVSSRAEDAAKDSNNSLGERASAGIDALGDKAKESKQCVLCFSFTCTVLLTFPFFSSTATLRRPGTASLRSTERANLGTV